MGTSLSTYCGPSIDVIVQLTEHQKDHCENHGRKTSDKYCPKCGTGISTRYYKHTSLNLNSDTAYTNSKGKSNLILDVFHDVSRWSSVKGIKTANNETKIVLIPISADRFNIIKHDIERMDFYSIDIDPTQFLDVQSDFEKFYITEIDFLRENYKINIVNRFISWNS